MQNFKYVAINLQRKKFTGVFMAEDEKDLATQLAQQNLFLVSCKPYSGGSPSAFFTMGTGSVSLSDLTTFCRQFSIMINSGISILECIASLKGQAFSTFFKNVLQVIYEDVKSGIMLSEALSKHEKVFPDFFVSMIYVGESSGKLDLVFNSLADYYEKDNAIKKKAKSAFSYPIMLICATIAIVVLMLCFVIPTFKSTLSGMDITPTGFTKVVYDISDFLTANWLVMLAIVCVVGGGLFVFGKTEMGATIYDKIKIRLPIIKKVQISLMCSRFARAFALLTSSGMGMVESLEAVTAVIGNREIKRKFIEATDDVKHGATLYNAFDKQKIFPDIMLQMINVGEKTAALEDVLNRSCNFFDEQTESTLNSATGLIQPVILCIMGVVIGTLFLAVYSPIISIMTSVM